MRLRRASGGTQRPRQAIEGRAVGGGEPGDPRAATGQRSLLAVAGPAQRAGAAGAGAEAAAGPAAHGAAELGGLGAGVPDGAEGQGGAVALLEGAEAAAVPAVGGGLCGGHGQLLLEQEAGVELAEADLDPRAPAAAEAAAQVGHGDRLGLVAV